MRSHKEHFFFYRITLLQPATCRGCINQKVLKLKRRKKKARKESRAYLSGRDFSITPQVSKTPDFSVVSAAGFANSYVYYRTLQADSRGVIAKFSTKVRASISRDSIHLNNNNRPQSQRYHSVTPFNDNSMITPKSPYEGYHICPRIPKR